MSFRNLTSDEVNFMIYRYLQESGFKHTAFSFANESGVQNCGFRGSEIPPGVLISFIQKGVQFLEIETRIKNKTEQVNYDTVFEMLLPDVPKEKLFARTIPDSIASSTTTTTSATATPNRSKSSTQIASSISSSSLSNVGTTSSLTTTTTTTSTPSSTTTGRRKNSNAEKAAGSARNGSGRPSKKSKQTTTTPSSGAATTTAATTASARDSHAMQDEEEVVHTMANSGGAVQSGVTPSATTTEDQQLPIVIDESQVTKLKGHTHEVFICAWNPVRSNVLASGSGDSTARIWELVKNEVGAQAAPSQPIVLNHGDPVFENIHVSTKDVTTLDWSADGKKLATGSYDGKARIWTADGQLKAVLDQHKGPIFSLKWNKQGNYLLSGSVDNTAIVWDIETGTVKQQFAHHTAPTLDVDWRNNTSFATCSTDRMIYVYELGTKDPIRTFAGHEDEVNAIRWSPNGSLLASCSDDFTAKIWSFGSTASQRCVFDLREHTKEIYTIKWSPTGPGTDYPNRNMVLASASFDATIKLWDPNVGKCLHSLTKHTDPVYSVAFSPDGKYLASGSFDRFLHIWSVHDGKLVKTYRGTGSIFEVCWNSTGDRVAACFSNSLTEEFNVCVLDFHM
ncbi:hypothetical protein C9374_009066 [Naegleria lovaniensis]|uniref:Guanine nucleotide-binding protein subunit beta-like protein n=1 Tax=Naegleria lovaniensis TaxID=51637 RepID=A0AA88GI75_NAELO|nr:uncharacterized protein C9374_009066 [Naegleria lovaniensis]KAG2377550.1 hypothetical protein C9374_009066 [Naegleria lovaniensis]